MVQPKHLVVKLLLGFAILTAIARMIVVIAYVVAKVSQASSVTSGPIDTRIIGTFNPLQHI
jgi:hypothetical protein